VTRPIAGPDWLAERINPKIAQLITLALAGEVPPIAPGSAGDMSVECKWCGATSRYGRLVMRAHSWHADDCLWRMAVEAVALAEHGADR
jgi:hypothetical protein